MRPEEHSFTTKGGIELTFLFNHRGIITAEKSGDTGFGKLLMGMAEGRLGFLAALIHGGLSTHHPEITAEDAWELMQSEGEPLATALGEALNSAMPRQQAGGRGAKNPPEARPRSGTGTRSRRPGSKKG